MITWTPAVASGGVAFPAEAMGLALNRGFGR